MSYYLAPSLVRLRNQVNARWPNRDKTSDGWIGDTRHQAIKSDHNPDYTAGGVVRALDIDIDGIDGTKIIAAMQADPRTAYIIFNHLIWTPRSSWKPYTGVNPHTGHVHISILHTKAAESDHAWNGLLEESPAPKPSPAKPIKKEGINVADLPTLKKGSKGAYVKRLQGLLLAAGQSVGKAGIDGDHGVATDAAVVAYQKKKKLKPDHIVGAKTWASLIGV